MNYKAIIKKIRLTPKKVVLTKGINKLYLLWVLPANRKADLRHSTYSVIPVWLDSLRYGYFSFKGLELSGIDYEMLFSICRKLLEHEFDLLGSGKVQVRYGLEANGVHGIKYGPHEAPENFNDYFKSKQTEGNYIFSKGLTNLIEGSYSRIDWQLDFKSGFKWDESVWFKDVSWGNDKGADIKVPWELARLQHLPFLAYCAYASMSDPGKYIAPEVIFNEFKNEIIDFITANPPRFGIHWSVTMEVSIRLVNILIALDLFNSIGFNPDEGFQKALIGSIYDHGLHIYKHPEWSSGMRGNHFLAGLAGLIFAAAYLPGSDETNSWLDYGLTKMLQEIEYQFLSDGGNFEASTYYHKFAAEMVFFSILILISLPRKRVHSFALYQKKRHVKNGLYKFNESNGEHKIVFSESIWKKLIQIATFTNAVSFDDFIMPQFGDNDSGYFIKLIPDFSRSIDNSDSLGEDYSENTRDCSLLIALIHGILKTEQSEVHGGGVASRMFRRVANNYFSGIPKVAQSIRSQFHDHELLKPHDASYVNKSFNEFGLYQFRNNYFNTYIRCGPIGQNGKGGHAHNDQLSFVLSVLGKIFIVDPGTYVYTPFPEMRNQFRSTYNHNTLVIDGMEQNPIPFGHKDDLFWLGGDDAKAECLKIESRLFIGEHSGYGMPHSRVFRFRDSYIDVIDECEALGKKSIHFHFHPDIFVNLINDSEIILKNRNVALQLSIKQGRFALDNYMYSHSYGQISEAVKAVITDFSDSCQWKIDLLSY